MARQSTLVDDDMSLGWKTAGFRRRGRIAVERLIEIEVLFRRPAGSDAVENLDAPQHDDNSRNQGGNGQHTFQGSHSHDTLRFPTP